MLTTAGLWIQSWTILIQPELSSKSPRGTQQQLVTNHQNLYVRARMGGRLSAERLNKACERAVSKLVPDFVEKFRNLITS